MFSVKTKQQNEKKEFLLSLLLVTPPYYNCELVVVVITLEKYKKKNSQHFTNARTKKRLRFAKTTTTLCKPPLYGLESNSYLNDV